MVRASDGNWQPQPGPMRPAMLQTASLPLHGMFCSERQGSGGSSGCGAPIGGGKHATRVSISGSSSPCARLGCESDSPVPFATRRVAWGDGCERQPSRGQAVHRTRGRGGGISEVAATPGLMRTGCQECVPFVITSPPMSASVRRGLRGRGRGRGRGQEKQSSAPAAAEAAADRSGTMAI
ncbi:hypothetical protein P171DRAFT_444917 [Karstenula rhodostoma CBS 690.94]|uniref:Uncharacterized protein n=1 Tax=Karstenula rhodostoma CBS 690.94 TaxID=1392251 RepID=A0A9P4PID4_9PLEO|nr:hypothetical protein P171DRAFT_444917 [Karstenula rhodostoma CBS 690.94]